MSLVNYDVILVTAFNYGFWLATELQRQGFKVLVVDLTSKLGVWPMEDVEGPFGLFKTENLKGSYFEFLLSEENYFEVTNGFTLWLDSGPMEFKGPLTKYQIQRSGYDPRLLESISLQFRNEWRALRQENLDFDSHWLLPFSLQLASSTYLSSRESVRLEKALPLGAPFFVRWVSRASLQRTATWLKSKGVDYTNQTDVIDLSLPQRKEVQGLELKGEKSGLFKSQSVVWGLSSEETYFYNSVLGSEIYPRGPVESIWSWVRYRIRIDAHPQIKYWPLHICLLGDKDSPWTHENLILWQKTSSDEFLDAWIRVPTVQRFNKNYLTLLGQKIVDVMKVRIEKINAEVHQYPQEYNYTYHQVGPARFPLFTEKQRDQIRKSTALNNLFVDSFEKLEIYTHEERQNQQEQTLQKCLEWRDALLRRQKKKEAEQ